jgi:hypothetical protein
LNEQERQHDGRTLNVTTHVHFEGQMDQRCYNLSTGNEIAILIPRNDEQPQGMPDIMLHLRDEGHSLKRIHECYSTYLPQFMYFFFLTASFITFLNKAEVTLSCRRIPKDTWGLLEFNLGL